jgi:hypothetical protein
MPVPRFSVGVMWGERWAVRRVLGGCIRHVCAVVMAHVSAVCPCALSGTAWGGAGLCFLLRVCEGMSGCWRASS